MEIWCICGLRWVSVGFSYSATLNHNPRIWHESMKVIELLTSRTVKAYIYFETEVGFFKNIIACQAPLSMEFSRQEYWNGLPFPPPEYLPNPGIKLKSLVPPTRQADSFPLRPLEKTLNFLKIYFNWRIITLQYCGSFCHTFTWTSHGCTYVPHRLSIHYLAYCE